MIEMRKLPRRSMSLHDRVNKSDVEDKSLSNDETPPPTCPRQPPDGVETPSDELEKIPEPPTRLPPRLATGWPNTRPRFSYSSRTQDPRSEASVKDKIAMFSNDRSISSDRLDKCGTIPRLPLSARKSTSSYLNTYSDVSSLDRRLTKSQDNLDEVPRTYKRFSERPEVLGALENAKSISNLGVVKHNRSLHEESKPLFYGSTTTLPSFKDTAYTPQIYHARSISDDNGNKNISKHKSNLEYLIEQRKKSMSKLRGLVIPEIQGPIVDLPEIKVQDSITKSYLFNSSQNNNKKNENKINNIKPITINETKWKTTFLENNIPKYSPAFKRKSLQVYSPCSLSKETTPEPIRFSEKIDTLNKINKNQYDSNFVRNSMDSNIDRTSTITSKLLASTSNKLSQKDYKQILNDIRDYKNLDIKICTATDVVDSDNESAMSSTQSSYRSSASSPMHNLDVVESDSSRLSPRISHYTSYSIVKTDIPTKTSAVEKSCEEYIKRNVCRSVSSDTNVSLSSSAGSAATSGSQASCSSLESSVADCGKKRISKTYNIDTINRRNILASAKCRSGRDAKLKSPVIETKFSHESGDRSPSPTHKLSDRLSTLTTSVSAISNKGENRRRNKVVAETDSDSDNQVNLRQRKTDYKNTRLKRNSSSANKNKQNEINSELSKIEDAPRVISEKIIKEIKKAGLDHYNNNKESVVQLENNIGVKQIKNVNASKESKYAKSGITLVSKDMDVVDSNNIMSTQSRLIKNNNNSESKCNKTLCTPVKDIEIATQTVRLVRGGGTGVGLILAGGIDCEAKDVTVHRVLADSVAAKAGLKRGVKVHSINGCLMNGLTHAQSVSILKEQRSEVVIEIETESHENAIKVGDGSENAESMVRQKTGERNVQEADKSGPVVTVQLEKAGGGAGLGFGLDGGRDSPNGDRPLTIKKLFAGGAAVQCGRIQVGAVLLAAGGQSMEGFTRTQAWAALKSLPAGPVTIILKNP